MKRSLACALALAAANTAAALTLPVGAHTYPGAITTVAAVRPAPDAGHMPATVLVPDDASSFRARLGLAVPVMTSWRVRSGDTLSDIAKMRYGTQKAWTLIYWANHKQVRWANRIQVGQILDLPIPDGPLPAPPRLLEPPPPPPPPVRHMAVTVASTSGYSTTRTYHSTYTAPSGTYHGSGSMEACIIARESGGNSQVMNSSGHYGLYQFSASTWAGSGGNPADFGHASVSEQRQVFSNAVSARGYSDWTPYDGC